MPVGPIADRAGDVGSRAVPAVFRAAEAVEKRFKGPGEVRYR
jgi:hypothetical protein